MIKLHTKHGVISIELNHEQAPKTAANFLQYAQEDFYTGTLFHRVIPNFMIQGGGFVSGLTPKNTREPIENEANNGLSNAVGSVAMARTSDPHSATAQFFINVANNTFLNHTAPSAQGWGYCVFGKVVDGMDVVNAIVGVPTTSRGAHMDVPVDDVIIEKVEVIEE